MQNDHHRGAGASGSKGLVNVAVFQPDIGESAGVLATQTPQASSSIEPAGDGFLQVNPDAFPNGVAEQIE